MIIDTHVHIGKIMNFDMKEEEVLYSMKKYGIDFSLVSNINGAENDHSGKPILQSQQKSQNTVFRETLDFAKKYPSKIGAVPWMKIRTEQPDREFVQLLKNNIDYVYAIKLHPFHSRTFPDDERMENIYKLAREFNLPVVSHTGGCIEAESIYLYNAAKSILKLTLLWFIWIWERITVQRLSFSASFRIYMAIQRGFRFLQRLKL